MDSNGTRFHLIHLKHDWESWWSVRHGVTLGELFDPANAFPAAEIEWNRGEENLRLARQALQFQGAATQPDTNLANRRGAGRDRYGHWYWIDEAQTGIYFLAQGEQTGDVLVVDYCRPVRSSRRRRQEPLSQPGTGCACSRDP